MNVVVLGAEGQLGRTVAARASARGYTVTARGRQGGDLTRPEELAALLDATRPEVVLNCAAYARVDEAEDDPVAAFAVNAFALRDLSRLARTFSFTLIHYSTDFVFDGVSPGPHAETDAPNPRGVYATSKLVGEWFAAEAPRHYILRVESLFGGPGGRSSVDGLLRGLLEGREVRAFEDRTVSPSFVDDVADASFALAEQQTAFGLYHCVNSGHATWLELTRELARLAGRPESLVVGSRMAGLAMRVPRPLHAALSNAKLSGVDVVMPDWHDALDRYVRSLAPVAHRVSGPA